MGLSKPTLDVFGSVYYLSVSVSVWVSSMYGQRTACSITCIHRLNAMSHVVSDPCPMVAMMLGILAPDHKLFVMRSSPTGKKCMNV